MTSREMFEQFFASAMDLRRSEDGSYVTRDTQLAWEAWRSSAQFYHIFGDG